MVHTTDEGRIAGAGIGANYFLISPLPTQARSKYSTVRAPRAPSRSWKQTDLPHSQPEPVWSGNCEEAVIIRERASRMAVNGISEGLKSPRAIPASESTPLHASLLLQEVFVHTGCEV